MPKPNHFRTIPQLSCGQFGEKLQSLETDRLIAFPLCMEDLPDLRLMHQDSEVMAYMGGIRPEEKTQQWLHKNLNHCNVHGFGIWMFRYRSSGQFVGRCGLRRVEVDDGNEVELAYALNAESWRKGLATEMAGAILRIGFERLELGNVIALIDTANIASRGLAEKLRFRFERNTVWKSEPAMLYRLKREEWIKPLRGAAEL